MRVMVDCTQITRNKAGVGIYALNLTRELIHQQFANLKLWFVVQDDDEDFAFEHNDVEVIRVPARIFRHLAFRFLLEQFYLPWLTRKHKIDVLHSLHYAFPLLKLKARKVVTFHDMTSFLMPEVHTLVKLRYFRFFIRAGTRWADALICVSESTRNDYASLFPSSSKPVYVTQLGKSPAFTPDPDPEQVRQTLERYHLKNPYVLYIGTLEPRKNLERLVEAFHRISDSFQEHILLIVGMKGWMYEDIFHTVRRLGLGERVVFTGFVVEKDAPYLMAGAEVFAYPSLYEGFGIPVLESLACGTPTLTSNVSSLPEVAGDAALLVDPESTNEIAQGLQRLLEDSALRDSLRKKAVAQAGRFSWHRTAVETLDIYAAVSAKTSSI